MGTCDVIHRDNDGACREDSGGNSYVRCPCRCGLSGAPNRQFRSVPFRSLLDGRRSGVDGAYEKPPQVDLRYEQNNPLVDDNL